MEGHFPQYLLIWRPQLARVFNTSVAPALGSDDCLNASRFWSDPITFAWLPC